MKDVKSLVVPVLMITGWFAIAVATLVQFGEMGGTLSAIERAEQARQAELHAPRVASRAPLVCAE
jgi:hypothetical protein